MSLSVNPISLRADSEIYVSNKVISTPFIKTKVGYNTEIFTGYYIVSYLVGVIKTAAIKEWVIKKNTSKKLKSPIIMGDSYTKFKGSCVLVFLKYFMNTVNFSKKTIRDTFFYLNKATNLLTIRLGIDVRLVKFNFCDLMMGSKFTNFRIKNPINNKLKNIEYKLVAKNNTALMYISQRFRRFSNNRYFQRIIKVFFSAFIGKKIDLFLVLNSVAFELSNLRKKHAKFIIFSFQLFKFMFNLFKTKHRLIGCRFEIKGRVIPYNRESRRAVLKRLLLGRVGKSDMGLNVEKVSIPTASRYGAINLSIYISSSKLAGNTYEVKSKSKAQRDYYNYFDENAPLSKYKNYEKVITNNLTSDFSISNYQNKGILLNARFSRKVLLKQKITATIKNRLLYWHNIRFNFVRVLNIINRYTINTTALFIINSVLQSRLSINILKLYLFKWLKSASSLLFKLSYLSGIISLPFSLSPRKCYKQFNEGCRKVADSRFKVGFFWAKLLLFLINQYSNYEDTYINNVSNIMLYFSYRPLKKTTCVSINAVNTKNSLKGLLININKNSLFKRTYK